MRDDRTDSALSYVVPEKEATKEKNVIDVLSVYFDPNTITFNKSTPIVKRGSS